MSFINLGLFILSGIFMNGRWIAPIAFWIAPFFMQRFLRKQKLSIGAISALIADYVVMIVSFWGVIPVEGVLYFLITFGLAAVMVWLPFFLDRLLYRKLPGFLSTLVLPIAFTLIEYATAMFSPYGAWGGVGATQIDHAAFAQIASLTGRWGIAFLVMWFPSVLNWIIENGMNWRKWVKGAALFGGILLAVVVYGNVRLNIIQDRTPTVRAAGISPSRIEERWDDPKFWTFYEKVLENKPLAMEEVSRVKSLERSFADELFLLTTCEADAGSKIIVWAETSLLLFEGDEKDFMETYRSLAQNRGIYLVTGVMVVRQATDEPFDNMAYLFSPDGTVDHYTKTKIVLGDEQRHGTGAFFVEPTPYGKLGVILCNDQLFPSYVGKLRGVDILAVPCDDWAAIDPYFTLFASLYSIEYGFNIITPAIEGLSAAYDFKGRTISQADYFTSDPKVFVAEVPVSGVVTPYSVLGDWLVYGCLAGVVVLVIIGVVEAQRRKRAAQS
jgi:apolipoprotein N-acyltransferase